MLGHHVASQSGDQGRLARLRRLVARVVPVPAPQRVSPGRLFGVEHHAAAFVCDFVHPRADREIRSALGAAVEHHEERRGSSETSRAIELIRQRPGEVRVRVSRRLSGEAARGARDARKMRKRHVQGAALRESSRRVRAIFGPHPQRTRRTAAFVVVGGQGLRADRCRFTLSASFLGPRAAALEE